MTKGLLLALVAAAGLAAPTGLTAPRPSPPEVWRMDGYGTVLVRDADRLQEYQVTQVGCLKGMVAHRTGGQGGAVRYRGDDGEAFTLRVSADPARASLQVDGSTGHRSLRRAGRLPAACTRSEPTGPVAAFDVFWQTFQDNYPFFRAKGVDWAAQRERHRPRIDASTTEDELFSVFKEMLSPLHDAHVAVLGGRPSRTFTQVRPGTQAPSEALDRRVKTYVEGRDLGGRELRDFARGRIAYADLPHGRGYLRISGFSGYTKSGTFAADSAELDRALDEILTPARTARLRGLIVDLRINGGGSDALGLRLAARLTDRPHLAYAKRARNDPADPTRFTVPQRLYVHPAAAPRYTGPVALLTGGSTVSAGETFTQALMDRPGRTVRIGRSTQGVFSDTLSRRLPNGWRILLPNEEFSTRTGETFDGRGIPPHLPEPVFTDEEFSRHRDSAFDRAVRVLSGTPRSS
ncbi:S41 family peptidase [Streptomyces monticola]|uniref:S41 family peptidase n=1 Tax=Streptomyces monticola TaxID=2666263 RepID=A0ABW2JF20_9ACTN